MPSGIYIRTDKHRRNTGLSQRGRKKPHSDEHKKHLSEAHKGKHTGIYPSEETRKKMSLVRMGHINSEESKRKQSIAMTGRKLPSHTMEHKLKISMSMLGKNKGKKYGPLPKETLQKISGKNHHNWKGGISFQPYSLDWTKTLRKSIRERDGYKCRLCGSSEDDTKSLNVHHIDYNKNNCNPTNLITLCHSCHTKTNFKREYWKLYFTK
jgi:hypothetical protein